jgi:hypothetical protein
MAPTAKPPAAPISMPLLPLFFFFSSPDWWLS